MTVGEKIKELRKKNHLTQSEVANQIGTAAQTIFKYEKNIVTNIPMDNIEKLSKIFDVTPSYLMGWDDRPKPKRTYKKRKKEPEQPAPGTPHIIVAQATNEAFCLSEPVDQVLPNGAVFCIDEYNKLNAIGKLKVNEYILDLSQISSYVKPSPKKEDEEDE